MESESPIELWDALIELLGVHANPWLSMLYNKQQTELFEGHSHPRKSPHLKHTTDVASVFSKQYEELAASFEKQKDTVEREANELGHHLLAALARHPDPVSEDEAPVCVLQLQLRLKNTTTGWISTVNRRAQLRFANRFEIDTWRERICTACHRFGSVLGRPLPQCNDCGEARYCNRDCQRDDWAAHRPQCRYLSMQD